MSHIETHPTARRCLGRRLSSLMLVAAVGIGLAACGSSGGGGSGGVKTGGTGGTGGQSSTTTTVAPSSGGAGF
jgi:hypothetical protein